MNFYILTLLLLLGFSGNKPHSKNETAGPAKLVFKSTDGGQTWQDISQGLPENLMRDGIEGKGLYANEKGLFITAADGIYHSTPDATTKFWTKESILRDYSNFRTDKNGAVSSNQWGVMVKKTNGTNIWSPLFNNDHEPRIRSVFETSEGTIFVGTNKGFFRTTDDGKTWKLVHAGTYAGHLAEANGVLVAASMKKIIRSTDKGETWTEVNSEDEVAFDVKQIKGGFAAITSVSETGRRRISTSYDAGKTWQSTHSNSQSQLISSIMHTWDDRPQVEASQSSFIQFGENMLCTNQYGIFKSSDKGKTWKLFLPAVKDKSFSVFSSGKVLYAISTKPGC